MKKIAKSSKIMTATIEEQNTYTKGRKVEVTVTGDAQGIYLKPKGYNDSGNCGIPVMLEVWGGHLRLVIWGDINQDEPTNIIDLEETREEKLK